MYTSDELIRIADELYIQGQQLVEESNFHKIPLENQLDGMKFYEWRDQVAEFLCSLNNCNSISCTLFSGVVTRPRVRHLEEGLRILFGVRDELAEVGGFLSESCGNS
jgi:hypothetical protein